MTKFQIGDTVVYNGTNKYLKCIKGKHLQINKIIMVGEQIYGQINNSGETIYRLSEYGILMKESELKRV